MKNTRKKLLVSSVAMLLVALLALSTATFAWFTSNPTATASGLTLKATASKGLVIQTATHGKADDSFWGHTDYLNINDTLDASKTAAIELSPVSFDITKDTDDNPILGKAYTVEAASDDNYAASDTTPVEDASAAAYYSEAIACKLTGVNDDTETADLSMTSMKITTTSNVQKTAIRVAIEYNGKLIGVYAPTATTNNFLTAPENYESKKTTYSEFKPTSKKFEPAGTNISLGEVGTTGTDKVNVTVYLDGEDSNCCSSKISASSIVTNVEVNLKVA